MASVAYEYCGRIYTFDGERYESYRTITTRTQGLDAFGRKVGRGDSETVIIDRQSHRSARTMPEGVADALQEKWAEHLAAEAAEAAANAAWQTKKAELAAEAAGEGPYLCPLCGHRQHSEGECEYCEDAIVSAEAQENTDAAQYHCEYCGSLHAACELQQDSAGNYACPACMGAQQAPAGGRIVITRHPALVQYLIERGYIPAGTPVIAHATEAEVRGRYVWGVLPLRLAALAASVTEIPLNLPQELRGRELTLEEVRRYAGKPETYTVSRA